MRIGIISSSGGSAFKAAIEILNSNSSIKHEYFVIVDRDCGIYHYCLEQGIRVEKITEKSNTKFSQQAAIQFEDWSDIDIVFLFFTRLVTKDIFDKFRLVNIHPSLLPEHKGFNAVENALKGKSTSLGATAHMVDETLDGGQIIVQTSTSLNSEIRKNITLANKISYCQKIWLMLFIVDYFEQGNSYEVLVVNETYRAFPLINPKMQNEQYFKAILAMQKLENVSVF
jgi:phosphoribosylglycinamide formyltransferase-1